MRVALDGTVMCFCLLVRVLLLARACGFTRRYVPVVIACMCYSYSYLIDFAGLILAAR